MPSVLIDTNLLVLLVVGLTSEPMIGKHKRTREYDKEAYSLLMNSLQAFTEIIVTAHVLTETSNLIRQCAEPLRTRVGQRLAHLITESREQAVPAAEVSRRPEYLRIGLTDAGILEAQSGGSSILLTDDHSLYIASLNSGYEAINFAHLRDAGAS